MSGAKRRLSGGLGLVGGPLIDESDEDNEELSAVNSPIVRKNKGSSRRGSMNFMGSMMMSGARSPTLNPVEQSRIAEMYKTVIQMSSENKLNEKNSWNYDLIDHMGKLIRDESQGVNFQKASCTLDASVKIYSNRVDDTYSTSHRILESLSRNGVNNDPLEGDDDDDDEDGENADGEVKKKAPKARVGTKASSNRLNMTSTIEKNPALLNAVKLEHDVAVDPLFHKMSKAFDEGGAKGMLLYNMRVSPNSSALSFNCSILGKIEETPPAEQQPKSTPAPSTTVDLSDLIQRAGLSLEELSLMELCPPLETYRQQCGVPECADRGLLEPLTKESNYMFRSDAIYEAFHRRKQSGSGATAAGRTSLSSAPVATRVSLPTAAPPQTEALGDAESTSAAMSVDLDMGGGDDGDDMGGYGEGDYGVGGMDDDNSFSEHAATTTAEEDRSQATPATGSTPGRQSISSTVPGSATKGTKLKWDSASSASVNAADFQLISEGLQCLNLVSEGGVRSDYAIFDVDTLVANNTWAGARHWKYATRRKEANNALVAAAAAREAAQAADAPAEETGEVDDDASVGRKRKSATSTAAGKKGSKAKAAVPIVFDLTVVDESAFDLCGKKKRDTTLMTPAAIEKATSEAEKNALLLPLDAKLQLKDLCRLFLVPKLIVPPTQFRSVVEASLARSAAAAASSSSSARVLRRMYPDEGQDAIWGQAPPQQVSLPGFNAPNGDDFDAAVDDDGRGYVYEDDDGGDNDYGGHDDYGGAGGMDDFGGGGDHNSAVGSAALPLSSGLEINKSNLVQATRKVEKIAIDYATVSKRVNIQRLKQDIWSGIDSALHIGEGGTETEAETAPAAATTESLSFQDMISDIAANPRQKDVSLPFYFICLLHLANEHGLRIEAREDMGDLVISMDKQ